MIEKHTVSVDSAQTNLWKPAKTETTIVRYILKENHSFSGNSSSFDEFATKIYGPEIRKTTVSICQQRLRLPLTREDIPPSPPELVVVIVLL